MRTLFSGDYHLGDNAGYYSSAVYMGLRLTFPCYVDLNSIEQQVLFRVKTQYVETLAGSTIGHPVHVNTTEIGQIVDTDNQGGPSETFDFSLAKGEFLSSIDNSPAFTLSVNARVDVGVGLIDDFILKQISVGGAKIRLGWV